MTGCEERKGCDRKKRGSERLKEASHLRFLILHNKGVLGWLEGLEGLPPRRGLRRVAALNDHLLAPPEVTLFWWCGDTCTHDYLNFQQRSSIPVTSFLPSFLSWLATLHPFGTPCVITECQNSDTFSR